MAWLEGSARSAPAGLHCNRRLATPPASLTAPQEARRPHRAPPPVPVSSRRAPWPVPARPGPRPPHPFNSYAGLFSFAARAAAQTTLHTSARARQRLEQPQFVAGLSLPLDTVRRRYNPAGSITSSTSSSHPYDRPPALTSLLDRLVVEEYLGVDAKPGSRPVLHA